MMEAPITDIERAIALLTVEYQIIDQNTAIALIKQARAVSHRGLVELVLERVVETTILKAIATEIGIRFCDLYATTSDYVYDEAVFAAADAHKLQRFSALPLKGLDDRVVIAVANPADIEMIGYIQSRYVDFNLVLASRLQIQNKLAYYASSDMQTPATPIAAYSAPTPVLTSSRALPGSTRTRSTMEDWVDSILERAVSEGASDVHFLLHEDKTLFLRFRIDGVLHIQRVPPQIRSIEVFGSIMVRCPTMDSSNYNIPQDGTFTFTAAGRKIDTRVAMLPQTYGPTMVIRLLDSLSIRTRLEDMGFSPAHLTILRAVMLRAQGTLLAVGPTGSGKSTTLYGLLREVNATEKNVLTVENPVEYRLPYIGQTEIRVGLGERSLTFPKALRTILRLDPDVILVGEIRDQETAEVAMQAAITGHMVLSTLHANSALSSFPRLTNMGLPSYLVAESISTIISQRLMRRVHGCAQIAPPTPAEVVMFQTMGLPVPQQVAHSTGCPACKGTGYHGRLAAVEVLVPSSDLRTMIMRQEPLLALVDQAEQDGFISIVRDGYRHVLDCATTVSEISRVLSMDENRNVAPPPAPAAESLTHHLGLPANADVGDDI